MPRAELYLLVDDPAAFHGRALAEGGRELSPLAPREWGHEAAYCLDPDGHVLAFAWEGEGPDAKVVPGEAMPATPPAKATEGAAQGAASRVASTPRAGDDPYRPPVPLLDQPARPRLAKGTQMPGTVIAVIVFVSILEAMQLINMISNPVMGLVPTGITALVLLGIIYGQPWARIMALVLSFLVLGGLAFLALGGFMAGHQTPGFLGMALPALLVVLLINLPIIVLLFTRSAKRHFGILA